jgi:predicted RND superfamily exporter protein
MEGFTPTTFTDQELLDKVSELHAKLVMANRMSFSAVPQIQMMIELCTNEIRHRAEQKMFEYRFGKEGEQRDITTCEELEGNTKKEIAKSEEKVETVFRMRRTLRPTRND